MIELNEDQMKFTICKGNYSISGSAEVGVIVFHIPSGIHTSCVTEKSQHSNKICAIEKLKKKLEITGLF